MTDIPIIFSGPMVRALLEGRKTMTRRLAWRPARKGEPTGVGSRLTYVKETEDSFVGTVTRHQRPSLWRNVKAGDRLWVRENFAHVGTCDPGFLTFQATYPNDLARFGIENVPETLKEAGYRWKPCIHMPRHLSRITLIVTGTRIERLSEIDEADARAEGVAPDGLDATDYLTYAGCFWGLWAELHGEQSVGADPEVVALTFRVIRANIDAPEAMAA
jgi:hypothetical protein